MKKFLAPLIFIGLLLLVADHYSYFEIIHKRPQSLHSWRQTDGASIALQYYNNGMDFFNPQVLFQVGDLETTGRTVSEFPGLYYLIAILWKIVGYNDIVFRQVSTLIFFLGLFALFRILQRTLKDNFWAMAIPILFFTSPSVVYYANNFMMDIPALSFSLIGWNLFFKFLDTGKQRTFIWAFFFFMIAGLLKIPALMSPVALCGIYVLGACKIIRAEWISKLKLNLVTISTMLVCFGVVASWYLFAIHYNEVHQTTFFSTRTFPIWEMSKAEILAVWEKVSRIWYMEYFSVSVQLLFLFAFLWCMTNALKQTRLLLWMNIILFLGVILFLLLWFLCYENHDYYIISIMILPLFTMILFMDHLNREHHEVFRSKLIRALFVLFLIFNINYTEIRLDKRFSTLDWMNADYLRFRDVHKITPYLREIGIKQTDKVISLPDQTPNLTLYLMNQPGWSQAFDYNMDSTDIYRHISLGAKYLILTESEPLSRPYLKSYLSNKIGEYGSVSIFKLQP